MTASMPRAFAVRIIVPTLPGSCIFSSTSAEPGEAGAAISGRRTEKTGPGLFLTGEA